MAAPDMMDAVETARLARAALEDKKGSDVFIFDVRGVSAVTDYVLITSGTSTPHLKALFNEVQHVLKKAGVSCYRRAGVPESGWLVLDYIDVVIHIFSTDARGYYAIEELWPEAPRIPSR